MKNHSHLTVARHLREKIHPIVLVVTKREGEEKGICSAVMRKVTKDRQRSDWRRMRSCHGAEQKVNNLEKSDCENFAEEKTDEYIDVEEMRVVTNDKHIAEQIKSDSTLSARECVLNRKVENGKVGKDQNLKSIVMNGVKSGKFGNCENNEETMSQSEERDCANQA